ncbi:AAA family ATPase [Candidatus Halobeggiatoa sp. HSG11]|nr:AAA family ATPase [Candidatus Halobeggiatoa sp. HSG11]
MYTTHFGLNAVPFSITPDPHYLYLSVRHREALAHLLYGVKEGPGFVLLTGEVGTGKTTLCRSLIEQLPETVDVALLLNPRLSSIELLKALFDELRISYEEDFVSKDFIDILSSYLLTAHSVGRRTVVILDEAQNLTPEVLEQVRLLTNLETANHKLLQIILVGQPELNTLLKRNNLRQLAQRITARYHLLPLSAKDTQAYINHRLAISGAKNPIFINAAMRLVYRYSGGIPRLINVICDRALLGGYVGNENKINSSIVRKAIKEVRGETIRHSSHFINWLIVIILLGTLAWWFYPQAKNIWDNYNKETISITQSETYQPIPIITIDNTDEIATSEELISEPIVEDNPTPESVVTLEELLPKTDTNSAFIALFNFWDLDYKNLTGEKACQRAATKNLACLLRTGNWTELRKVNRPAVIELVTNDGNQHHLVVTKLKDDIATVAIAGVNYEFPITEINKYWLGQFLLLWQPPLLPVPVLKIGLSNNAVIWIRKHLDSIEGVISESYSPRFDYALRTRIIAFQRQQQLDADGIVGEQTMLVMQALSRLGPLLVE